MLAKLSHRASGQLFKAPALGGRMLGKLLCRLAGPLLLSCGGLSISTYR
jgi:hypothetical protein